MTLTAGKFFLLQAYSDFENFIIFTGSLLRDSKYIEPATRISSHAFAKTNGLQGIHRAILSKSTKGVILV